MKERTQNFLAIYFGPLLILICGIVVLAVGIFALTDQQGVYEKTTGTIEEITVSGSHRTDEMDRYDYSVFVTYTANGTLYENVLLDSYRSSMKEGDTIALEYNVDFPEKVREPGDVVIPYVMMGVGGAMFVLGIVWTVKRRNRNPEQSL